MAEKQAGKRPPQFRAKHYDPSTGDWKVGVDLRVEFSLDEAARALAKVYPTAPTRFGLRTAMEGIQEAARRGIRTRSAQVSEAAVAYYRDKLLELGVFPESTAQDEHK